MSKADKHPRQTPSEWSAGERPAPQDTPSSPGREELDRDPSQRAEAEAAASQPGIAELEQELAESKSRELRAHAELENFRKRVYRQLDEDRKYACIPLIRDLLPILDNLQRALQASDGDREVTGLRGGVSLVAESLSAALRKHQCTEIPALGEPFDPHVHEALVQMPSVTVPAGHVAGVASVGYQLHDRVVRPAQVMVSSGPPAAESNAPT